MANKTLTQLTELELLDKADIMYVVDDPSGTPLSRKTTVENVLQAANTLDANTAVDKADEICIVDDPSGTPAAQKATVANILKATNTLDANTTVAPTDIMLMVDDPSGTPAAQKATVAEILKVGNSVTADTPVYTDIGTFIDDPSGTPEVNKATLQAIVKAGASQGAVSGLIDSNLTASRAVEVDGTGKIVASAVTSEELSYIGGVTSAIQTQLNTKVPLAGYTTANQATSVDYYTKIASIDLTAQYQANAFTANVIGYNEGTTDQFEFAMLSVRVNQAAAMESAPDINVKVCNNQILNSSNFHAVLVTNSASHTIVEIYLKMTKDYQAYTIVPLTSAGTGTTTFYSSQTISATLPAGTKEAGEMVIPPQFSTLMQQYVIDKLATIVTAANIERLIFFDASGTSTEITDRAGVDNADLGQAANNTDPGVAGCARTLRFDGSTTYFEFADATDLTPTADGHAFSVVACVKPKSVNIAQEILAKCSLTTGSTQREWEFYLDASNKLTAKFWDDSTGGYGQIGSNNNISYDLNNWNCYGFSYNGWGLSDGLVTYRNGQYWNDAGYSSSGSFTSVENKTAKCGNYRLSTAGAKENISNMEYGVVLIINEQLSQTQQESISNLFRLYVGSDLAAV